MIEESRWKELTEVATGARQRAYAPYSGYTVGAAVLGADGRVYGGCNVENVSFGLSICAERAAICRMVAEGCRGVHAAVVVTRDAGTPCGMCLQVLLEFTNSPRDVRVRCTDSSGSEKEYTLAELIPHGFTSEIKKT